LVVRGDVVVDERAKAHRELVVRAAQGRHVLAVDEDGTVWRLAVPGRLMPMFAAFDSPGPFTTQPITARVRVSTPSYCCFHDGSRSRM
jgi:hypothetical protein